MKEVRERKRKEQPVHKFRGNRARLRRGVFLLTPSVIHGMSCIDEGCKPRDEKWSVDEKKEIDRRLYFHMISYKQDILLFRFFFLHFIFC